jgi:hypothetical protein
MSDKSKEPAKPQPKIEVIGPGEIVMEGKGGLAVATDRRRLKSVKDNSDIGIRQGRKSSEDRACKEAERLLKAGYPGGKDDLAKHLSTWLLRHHGDEPEMTPEVVERKITSLWQKYRPEQSRPKTQK